MLTYRLGKTEAELDKVNKTKADKEAVDQIAEDVRGIRKLFLGLIATIGSSAVVFALTVLEILANQHGK